MEFDSKRVEKFMRWTKHRFKDKSPRSAWNKIQENAKLKRDYENFDKYPKQFSQATYTIEFALKAYGWRELVMALWLVATAKEESMALLGFRDDEDKWRKIKDKIAQMPKNVQL